MAMARINPQNQYRSAATGDRTWHQRVHAAALDAARAAGRVQQKYFGGFQKIDAECEHDLKLAIDRHSEQAMLQVLQDRFPDHGIISEESAALNPDADYCWYLDPLDGSVNYFLGQPYFCVCVACYDNRPEPDAPNDPWRHPLAGVVYAPMLDLCFEAMAGRPARCNGGPVQIGGEQELGQAVIGFSFGSDPETMRRMLALSADLVAQTRKVRIFGATGLDLAHVASGRLSGLVQGRVRGWDFAAARVIIEAAGGYFRADPRGPDQWKIVAAAPGIATQLQDLVDRNAV
jgi:myo-inositol-1(or 4)-monophosphatase